MELSFKRKSVGISVLINYRDCQLSWEAEKTSGVLWSKNNTRKQEQKVAKQEVVNKNWKWSMTHTALSWLIVHQLMFSHSNHYNRNKNLWGNTYIWYFTVSTYLNGHIIHRNANILLQRRVMVALGILQSIGHTHLDSFMQILKWLVIVRQLSGI